MKTPRVLLDPKIRFLISIPDWRPDEATPFQGFALSLCQKSGLLNFIQQMPTDIFELTPSVLPYRIARRIAGQAPINWYGQSPRAIKAEPLPIEAAFTLIVLDETESASQYDEWAATCPGPISLVAEKGGHLRASDLSFENLRARFLQVCDGLRALGTVESINKIQSAIVSWAEPQERRLPYEIGGHGTIFPNASVLRACGYVGVAQNRYSRHHEGEQAHVQQIVLTANTILDERMANPPSFANLIYPRTPDLNLYCPATYDLKSALSVRSSLDRDVQRDLKIALDVLDRQLGYSFELSSKTKVRAVFGITADSIRAGEKPTPSPIFAMRQREIWLGTEAVGCLAVSEIGAVIRLPNRLNRTRSLVRQFAQHYRAERPQMRKRRELFRGIQRAIAESFPADLQKVIERSRDGIRVIADAHLEWLDVRGMPLGLRYNVSRIPVTPGNLFIDTLSSSPPIHSMPEDFRDILVISGLPEADVIAQQFRMAFDIFGQQWRDKIRIKFVRASSRREMVDAINAFEGLLMVFDGHGSHNSDQAGLLWLGEESIDVWSLREEVRRAPPIVILSACDTHAADRNHATVASGFLALGSRSVLGSVFPLHASHAAIFTARLLFRVSDYIPAALKLFKRSLTWLEVVSGMLRRQIVTDLLRHLTVARLINENDQKAMHFQMCAVVDSDFHDPFFQIREELLKYGIPKDDLDREIHNAVAASSTISYVHIGRPETILINTADNLEQIAKAT